MVREQNWLGSLKMCISGHDDIFILLGLSNQCSLQSGGELQQMADPVSEEQTLVESNLVIAAPGRMHPSAGFSDSLHDQAFDCHVDIVCCEPIRIPLPAWKQESARSDFAADSRENISDLPCVL
jgi:hypothetical protein